MSNDRPFLVPELLDDIEGGNYGDMGGIFADGQTLTGDGVTIRIPSLKGHQSDIDQDAFSEGRWRRWSRRGSLKF